MQIAKPARRANGQPHADPTDIAYGSGRIDQPGPGQAAPGQAGPPVARRRRPLRIALAVLLLAACGLGGAYLYTSTSHSSSVVEVRRNVPRGSVLTALDLTAVTIGQTVGVNTVPADQLATQVGQIAKYDLTAGSLLNPASLTIQAQPDRGRVQIGLRLQPGQIPTEPMTAGTPLQLVYAPSGTNGGGGTTTGGTASGSTTSSAAAAAANTAYPAVLVSMANEADGTAVQMTVDVPATNSIAITKLAAAGNIGVIRLSTRH